MASLLFCGHDKCSNLNITLMVSFQPLPSQTSIWLVPYITQVIGHLQGGLTWPAFLLLWSLYPLPSFILHNPVIIEELHYPSLGCLEHGKEPPLLILSATALQVVRKFFSKSWLYYIVVLGIHEAPTQRAKLEDANVPSIQWCWYLPMTYVYCDTLHYLYIT